MEEPCASVAFMVNLVYDRGVALEYDLVHDRLEDAERRLADLEDMMPQVYGLTELTTSEERAGLVSALGRVRRYVQEGDTVMGQGAADEFNALFRAIMWNIVIRCEEQMKLAVPTMPVPPKYVEITDSGDTRFSIGEIIPYEEFSRENDRVREWGRIAWSKALAEKPSRPYPETYGDWVDLAEDIKEKDPNSASRVNGAMYDISEETRLAEEQKRWLVEKARELGIY